MHDEHEVADVQAVQLAEHARHWVPDSNVPPGQLDTVLGRSDTPTGRWVVERCIYLVVAAHAHQSPAYVLCPPVGGCQAQALGVLYVVSVSQQQHALPWPP